jgi:hypothetical protein
MHNSYEEIYISNMNFINPEYPEFNFKNKIRKIKKRDFHNSKKGTHKLYFQTTLSILKVDNPWKHI